MIPVTPKLKKSIQKALEKEISRERKEILKLLIDYILKKRAENSELHLNFICTHNSRRSQFSQIWAHTAAAYYGIPAKCYSGGVEVTAFNERAVASIERCGFLVSSTGETNPHYHVTYHKEAPPLLVFSKLVEDPVNPTLPFAAVMTCAHADENCPFIPGTEQRIPLQYEDPKVFDNTPIEKEKYDERSLQIASELFYVFKSVCKALDTSENM
jgi:arsenate reductase